MASSLADPIDRNGRNGHWQHSPPWQRRMRPGAELWRSSSPKLILTPSAGGEAAQASGIFNFGARLSSRGVLWRHSPKLILTPSAGGEGLQRRKPLGSSTLEPALVRGVFCGARRDARQDARLRGEDAMTGPEAIGSMHSRGGRDFAPNQPVPISSWPLRAPGKLM